jgi:RND superfamily putative drug exporter
VLCRYREELSTGVPRERAIVRAMSTAGRSVLFSGVAVGAGLGLLVLVPVPFVRTMGIAGLLLALVSVVGSLTLLPAQLSLCGPRVLAGLPLPRPSRRREPWSALARTVMRHPVTVLVATTALLLAAAAPALFLRVGPGSPSSLPLTLEATRGIAEVGRSFGPGALLPTEVIVDAGRAGAARKPVVHAAIERLADALFHDPEVFIVATGQKAPYVSRDGRYARVVVIGRHDYGAAASRELVERIRRQLVPAARFPTGTLALAGGAPPMGVDFVARILAVFPWIVALTLAVTYGVLARAFRSALLPLQAVLLNLLSVAAAYGLLVGVCRFGVGAGLLGVHRSAEIDAWIPVFLFVALFSLSMDYEVFLVSRMREKWDESRNNAAAVAFGLERTGRVITAAALVMVISLSGFVAGNIPVLQQFGLGLALAVLIDATLVRALLVPASIAVSGRWSWWSPGHLVRPQPRLPLGGLERTLE